MQAQSGKSLRATLSLVLLLFLSAASFADSSSSASEQDFATVVQRQADATHGQQVFDTCTACHGDRGNGVSDGTVPAIAGQHFRVIVWELVKFRRGERLDPRMHHFTDRTHLNGGAQDIADVAAYVSHLQPFASTSRKPADHVADRDDLYRHNCSSCHGERAQGNNRQRNPQLAGQHYEYLLRRLQLGVEGQHNSTSVRHDQLRHQLTPQDLSAICEYVSQLSP